METNEMINRAYVIFAAQKRLAEPVILIQKSKGAKSMTINVTFAYYRNDHQVLPLEA